MPNPDHRHFGLDLARAAAVAGVLISHTGDMLAHWFGTTNLPFFSYCAFYGIELFFVLSGFLIGRILITEAALPDRAAGFRLFMLRRWLRTLPAYYAWLLLLALLWAKVLIGPHPGRIAAAVLLHAALLQNLAWPPIAPDFFDVSWSLAVEEWFYLGFAALLFLLSAHTRTRRLALPLTLLPFLLLPPLCRFILRANPTAPDHLVPLWLDQIAIGVLAAALAAYRPRLARAAAWALPAAAGLMVFMYQGGLAFFGVKPHWRRVLDEDVWACALALLLLALLRWPRARFPGAGAVSALSRLAYPLYLVHLSVLVFIDWRRAAWHLPPLEASVLALAAIAACAYALAILVERPVMRRRPRARSPAAASASAPAAEAQNAIPAPGGA